VFTSERDDQYGNPRDTNGDWLDHDAGGAVTGPTSRIHRDVQTTRSRDWTHCRLTYGSYDPGQLAGESWITSASPSGHELAIQQRELRAPHRWQLHAVVQGARSTSA